MLIFSIVEAGYRAAWDMRSFQTMISLTDNLGALNVDPNRFRCALFNAFESNIFRHIVRLYKETITGKKRLMLPSSVQIFVIQSCYIQGGFVCALFDYKAAFRRMKDIWNNHGRLKEEPCWRQTVSCIGWDRSWKYKKQSFVIMQGHAEWRKGTVGHRSATSYSSRQMVLRTTKSLTTCYCTYMEVKEKVSCVDRALGCVCFRRTKEDEVDCTVDKSQSRHRKQAEAEKYYRLVEFNSIVSSVHLLRANIANRPFTFPFYWPLYRLYLNPFLTQKGLKFPTDTDSTDGSEKEKENNFLIFNERIYRCCDSTDKHLHVPTRNTIANEILLMKRKRK